ncbi:MAG: hypothetical protein FJY88_03600 [Candidatus Eisenbacteria bacterium]|nr:hypothetical protein [Candidatus Eisenbacteria bacterium]
MKAVVPILMSLALATAAAAQTPTLLWSFQGNGSIECIAAIPDIDGDGGVDVVFEGYGNGPSGVEHVFAIRGRSSGIGEVIWSARPIGGASSGGGDGDNCLRIGADLNGDLFPDVLLGTAWGGRTAYALNGISGATLWGFDTYVQSPPSPPSSGWVYAIDNLGTDLTADGVPEVVFCTGSYNDRIYGVNGATGSYLWNYWGNDAFFDVRSCQDINYDGVRDVVAALGDDAVAKQVVAREGSCGCPLWSRPINGTIWNLTFVGDVNGDGISEIVPASWGNTLNCINGRTGAIIWSVPASGQQRVVALDDVNGDGFGDVAVGYNTTSACAAYSGINGALIWSRPTSDWVWAVDRIGDCTDDDINDVVAGDFDGWVYLLDGVDGTVVWSWRNPTTDKIMTIRGVPDLNGNGAPDVVAGTQLLTNGTGGDVYALEGNEDPLHAPDAEIAGSRGLTPTFPNPFTASASWSLRPDRSGNARVLVFGSDGRLIREVARRDLAAGEQIPLIWDGRDGSGALATAGIYHLRVLLDGRPYSQRRAVLVR